MTAKRIARLVFLRLLPGAVLLVACTLLAFRLAAVMRETSAIGADLPVGGRMIETALGGIFILEHGPADRTPVLFSHGTGAWAGLWAPTLKAMGANGIRAIGYDLPPFGFSDPAGARRFERQDQAARIVALLETFSEPPILVAHSVSAGPVAEAVMQGPERVAGLVIVAGAIGLGSHEQPTPLPLALRVGPLREALTAATLSNPWLTATFLRGFVHRTSAVTPAHVETLKAPMRRKGYTRAASDWLPALLVPPRDAISTRKDAWAGLDLPVVLIWGDKDDVTPLTQARALHALLPQSRLEVLSDVGHIPQIEAPETFRPILLRALGEITDQGRQAG